MGQCFLHGSGGSSGGRDHLAAQVVASENAPSNPKTGTIWVKPFVPMTNLVISNGKQISSWGAQNGAVYIQYSYNDGWTPPNVNVIRQYNGEISKEFEIKLIGATQKVDGAVKDLDAYLWDGNKWYQFNGVYNGELFYNGDQFTNVTGGWNPTGSRMSPWNDGWTALAPEMEIKTNMLVYEGYNPCFGTIFTNHMIDVTKYSKLKANVKYDLKGAGYNNGFWLGVSNNYNDQYTPLASFMAQTESGEKSYDGDISIDISGITGSVFVFIACVRQTSISEHGPNAVTFRKIWLE